MEKWQIMLDRVAFTPEGSGTIVHLYDARKVAIIAYVEGMQMFNSIMEKWVNSGESDPMVINKMIEDHVEELKNRFNL